MPVFGLDPLGLTVIINRKVGVSLRRPDQDVAPASVVAAVVGEHRPQPTAEPAPGVVPEQGQLLVQQQQDILDAVGGFLPGEMEPARQV